MSTLGLALTVLGGLAAIGALIAFRRRERAWDQRMAKLRDLLYQAALRESALNTEIAVARAEVEFWREGTAFERGAAYDTRTRAIVR